jgi:hypothetical protein
LKGDYKNEANENLGDLFERERDRDVCSAAIHDDAARS